MCSSPMCPESNVIKGGTFIVTQSGKHRFNHIKIQTNNRKLLEILVGT